MGADSVLYRLVPLLKDQSLKRDAICWHYPQYGNQGGFPGAVIRQDDWKLIEKFDGGVELYNLRDDIGERTNLAGREPERAKAMLDKLKAWQQDLGVTFPTVNPDYPGK